MVHPVRVYRAAGRSAGRYAERICPGKLSDTNLEQIFLVFNTTDTEKWSTTLSETRKTYEENRTRFLQYIKHPEALADVASDPLADDPEVQSVQFPVTEPIANYTSLPGRQYARTKSFELKSNKMFSAFLPKQIITTPTSSRLFSTCCLSTASCTPKEAVIDKECTSFLHQLYTSWSRML